eukprot:jgi/Chlat1/8905/Chrsp92S08219
MAQDAAAGGGGGVCVDEKAKEVKEEVKKEEGLECVVFTLIVDDIVMPDGTTAMAQLGGGGPQTAFGYALWAVNDEVEGAVDGEGDVDDGVVVRRARRRRARIGLAAGVGEDLPQSCRDWLDESGVSCEGLVLTPNPTPRAWQVHEEDGRRTQVHPEYPPLELLAQLRTITEENNGVLSVEPFTHSTRMLTWHELSTLASAAHIFSPNRLEAESMDGAVVRSVGGTSVTWGVPAYEVDQVVDVTGCGNAFCGGFLDGYVRTRDVLAAAVQGVVAASFVAECVGLPVLKKISRREVKRRTEWVRARATRLA